MEIGKNIPDDLINGSQYWGRYVKIIRNRVKNLFNVMKDASDGYEKNHNVGIEIELLDNEERDIYATIQTPFGITRARLELSRRPRADIYGVVVFEKKLFDKYDQAYWEPVWAIEAGEDDYFISSGEPNEIFDLRNDPHKIFQSYKIVQKLNYAMLVGPQF